MNRPMVDARYSGVAVTLHWLIALLVLFNLLVGIGHDAIPALRALMPAHKAAGITVLVLTAARLGWRPRRCPPRFRRGSAARRGRSTACSMCCSSRCRYPAG